MHESCIVYQEDHGTCRRKARKALINYKALSKLSILRSSPLLECLNRRSHAFLPLVITLNARLTALIGAVVPDYPTALQPHYHLKSSRVQSIPKHVISLAILISRFSSFRFFPSQIKLCKHVRLLPLSSLDPCRLLQLFLFRKLAHETWLPRSCLDRQSWLVTTRLYWLLAK
jgi:hypothetical protein